MEFYQKVAGIHIGVLGLPFLPKVTYSNNHLIGTQLSNDSYSTSDISSSTDTFMTFDIL